MRSAAPSAFWRKRLFTHGQNAQGDRHVNASRTRLIPEALLPLFERTS
jgi:DNA helicase-2/ATP-dependent DNA helicase PcrA